jgi:peptidoglycan/xylan/chitin deacetylase (PgdA/CDA1 family)
MIWLYLFLVIFAVVSFLTVQYSIFLPPVKGIPVLMYHQVKPSSESSLSILPEKLESHFLYLLDNGYSCLKLETLLNEQIDYSKKNFVLTFDDAYVNNLDYLYPLLIKHNLHATIMLPVNYLGKVNEWDGGNEKIMTVEQLKSMDSKFISFGLHSYSHQNLKHLSLDAVESELKESMSFLYQNFIDFLPVLSYPYGGFPREKSRKKAFFDLLEKHGLKMGLRIGNKINRLPIKNKFEICRIDIKGTDSMWEFKTKVRKGHVKML